MLFSSKLSQLLLIWVILVSFASISTAYSGGSGTQADPYKIATAQDLIDLGNATADYDKYFIMTADIDLAGRTFTKAVIGSFKGNFNGNSHKIENLSIGGSTKCGLFGHISSGGLIKNLGLENVSVTGTGAYVAGLCSYNSGGKIENCYVTGDVIGKYSSSTGGLCGDMNSSGSISSSYFDGTVFGVNYVGGICGSMSSGSIISSSTNCVINGSNYVGGICGKAETSSISSCFATGSVDASSSYYTGGLCGYGYKTNITSCYANNSVSGYYAGGLLGYNQSGVITSCYATGSVSGSYAGGLCYSNYGSLNNCYFYVYGGPDNGYGVALTDEQLTDKSSFIGFDFAGDTSDGTNDNWLIDAGHMPRLSWQAAPGLTAPNRLANIDTTLAGSGNSDDPFVIGSKDDMLEFHSNPSLRIGYYRLDCDIDLSDITCDLAFIPEMFMGNFDGNKHIIYGLTINGGSYLGLFANIAGGSVQQLGLKKSLVIGTGTYVGGLCGRMYYGSVYNCFTTGIVTGGNYTGGLCGYISYSVMQNCYAQTSMSCSGGYDNIGGLCGYVSGSITNCYSTGLVVNAAGFEGGLIGIRSSGTVTGCFWDKQSSSAEVGVGTGSVTGMTGLDTATMQTMTSFTDAGWDFSDTDGDDADWQMQAGWYPVFAWEDAVGLTQVPDLAGMTIEQAQVALQDSGLTLGMAVELFDMEESEFILKQAPVANSSCQVGYYVNIFIPSGFKYSGGIGTQADPYQIATPQDLIDLGNTPADYSKYFIMTADIDLTGITFTKSVIAPNADEYSNTGMFSGVFNGNGRIVSNLTISSTGNQNTFVGFFGAINSNASVFDLGLENVSIDSKYHLCVGGLCGVNYGRIDRCFTTGTIIGYDSYTAGGLCGSVNRGSVNNSYSTCTVVGSQNFAGLIGAITGTGPNSAENLNNCYATGFILRQPGFPESYGGKGGLCGVINYSVLKNSFWDIETGFLFGYGRGSMDGITNTVGKTTAQMQDISTFTSAGWDFTTDDGDAADWKILPGCYPALSWETLVTVPDVSDMTLADARERLDRDNFTVVTVNCDSDLPVGTLVAQSPIGTVRPTTPITLYVSNGTKKYAGGSGIAECPYKISTADELILIGNTQTDYGKYFILTNDIDLTGRTFTRAIIAYGTYGTSAVARFSGNFNGNGFSIKNLTISSSGAADYTIGLFGRIADGAVIKNVNVKNVNLYGYSYVGGICGYNYYGHIINCSVSGVINGRGNYVGGLCGYSYGRVVNCDTFVTVSNVNINGGGLCGINDGIIENCHSSGTVSGYDSLGGLCGTNTYNISNCFSTCEVTSTYNNINYGFGGFCGQNSGTITNSFASGKVTGYTNVGGFCGWNSTGNITNCYATGMVASLPYTVRIGGFCGLQDSSTGIIKDCFWDTQSSLSIVGVGRINAGTVTNVQGKTTLEMQDVATFTAAGWDFTTDDGDVADWQIVAGSYPFPAWDVIVDIPSAQGLTLAQALEQLAQLGIVPTVYYYASDLPAGELISQIPASGLMRSSVPISLYVSTGIAKYSGGSGTPDKPYKIASKADLLNMAYPVVDYDKHFILTADIDLSGSTYFYTLIAFSSGGNGSTFVGTAFTGGFDGNGFVIKNFDMKSDSSFAGLFGYLGRGGYIKNLGLINAKIINLYSYYAGGLCGYNNGGSITNCYVSGTISGNYYTGGLCGYNSDGKITECYVNGSVTGDTVGGLCSYNLGLIKNSYSTCSVFSSNGYSGGLCYSNAGVVSGSFWDNQTSGQSTSAGGTGLTTAQMQDVATFTAAGWDFSTSDGDAADWQMKVACYPLLNWQIADGDIAGSNAVDQTDLEYLATNWLDDAAVADLDGDAVIDMADFAVLAGNWLVSN